MQPRTRSAPAITVPGSCRNRRLHQGTKSCLLYACASACLRGRRSTMSISDVALIAGTVSTSIFVASYLPMLVKAARSRDLSSYSVLNLVLANVGNGVHSIYVFSLPAGPLWALHTFYLVSSGLMLWWWVRFRRPQAAASDESADAVNVLGDRRRRPPSGDEDHEGDSHRRALGHSGGDLRRGRTSRRADGTRVDRIGYPVRLRRTRTRTGANRDRPSPSATGPVDPRRPHTTRNVRGILVHPPDPYHPGQRRSRFGPGRRTGPLLHETTWTPGLIEAGTTIP